MATTRVKRVPAFLGSFFLFAVLAAPSVALAQRGYGGGAYDPDRDYKQESQRDEFTGKARIQVEPRDAEVYVDGRYAGRVDEFDGLFQRLRVTPGNHQIAIWREGYRTEYHNLYFNRDETEYLRGDMERLRSGMASGPRPGRGRGYAWGRPDWAGGPNRPGQYPDQPYPKQYPNQQYPNQSRWGTLSLAIPVSGAEIYVDGSRRSWQRRDGNKFELDLTPGRHRVEVRRSGYQTFARDVTVRPGEETAVNVSMRRGEPR